MNTFQYAARPAPLASSLRDTEWRQLCRHSELRHSSLLPQSLCGRLSSSAVVLCGAGSALVRMWDLCRADMSSCYLPPHLLLLFVAVLHVCVGGRAHATMFPLSVEAWIVCRGMCDFDSLPIQAGAAVICCLVSVCAVQEPHLHRESWQGGFGLLMADAFHLPRFSLEIRLPPAECSQLQRKDQLKWFYL